MRRPVLIARELVERALVVVNPLGENAEEAVEDLVPALVADRAGDVNFVRRPAYVEYPTAMRRWLPLTALTFTVPPSDGGQETPASRDGTPLAPYTPTPASARSSDRWTSRSNY